MTIKEKIEQDLTALQTLDPEIYKLCFQLNISVDRIIGDVKDHLSTILQQMPDYDKHDATHSEKVLSNIELLLHEDGVKSLTLLEAMLLRLCCYFHDAGMALPSYATSLLLAVEKEEYEFHRDSPIRTIIAELRRISGKQLKSFDQVKDQFFCPSTEDDYLSFLAQEIYDYEQYRIGLSKPDADEPWESYCKKTRQGYLRSTHGLRVKKYANNIDRLLGGLKGYDAKTLAGMAGNICQSHCMEITDVRKLSSCIKICRGSCSGEYLTCNERYLAMLLRLGDVIHFSEDRVSRTLYAEHTAMDHESDMHWQVKFSDLTYTIERRDGKLEIIYFGGFRDPEKYYFLQDHFDWVDDELHYYAAFVQDMEQEQPGQAARYRLGLPTNVTRNHIQPIDFSPDNSLKFRLEQRKVIELLMGLRLYRNEFMCLRELYQNALDACRCMRAENRKHGLSGDLSIEFGVGSDGGGAYLYCKDEGIGMTQEIVKNFLLRVGNSYYKSAEFRRANMGWDNTVVPVSEFGIGLLSCYMIADRIEIITRHFSSKEKPIWVCMEGTEDYGYYRNTSVSMDEWIGDHGTIVKLYLKKAYQDKVTGYLPEDLTDAIYELELLMTTRSKSLPAETIARLKAYNNSLHHRVQQFVHIPEQGIPVFIQGQDAKLPIITANAPYDLPTKLPQIIERGFSFRDLGVHNIYQRGEDDRVRFGNNTYHLNDPNLPGIICDALKKFQFYTCAVHDGEANADAFVIFHLPICADDDIYDHDEQKWDQPIIFWGEGIYIDGMPVRWDYDQGGMLADKGIRYHFSGALRPSLTVDRGSIRDFSDEVVKVKQKLYKNMVQELATQIRTHFEKYPQAKTEFALQFVYNYLCQKFDVDFCTAVLERLSEDLLADYPLYGAAMDQWFHHKQITVDADSLRWQHGFAFVLLASILYDAENVQIADNGVTIQRSLPLQINEKFEGFIGDHVIFCADMWPEEYKQYDAVSAFSRFVPKHVFALIPKAKQFSDHCNFVNSSYDKLMLSEICALDAVKMTQMNLADVILLLGEDKEKPKFHTKPAMDQLDEEGKKYVFYCYVTPRPVLNHEQQFVQQYDHIPEYRRGIENGWSILFYRYKDGYTIAPGIVDRTEMVKRIPKEALEHNDGIAYCFTDGTKAF